MQPDGSTEFHEEIKAVVTRLMAKYYYLPYDTRQDLYQEGYIGAWKAAPKFRADRKHFHNYLRIRAHYAMVDFLRKHGRLLAGQDNQRSRPHPVILPIEDHTIPCTDRAFAEVETEMMITWCFHKIPPGSMRRALSAYVEGRKYVETAKMLGNHAAAIRGWTRGALTCLRHPDLAQELRDWYSEE